MRKEKEIREKYDELQNKINDYYKGKFIDVDYRYISGYRNALEWVLKLE